MIWHIDVRQVSTHQLVFIVGRCQKYFVRYVFPLNVGPFTCVLDSKVFPAHVNPRRRQAAMHSLGKNFMASEIPCQFNQKRAQQSVRNVTPLKAKADQAAGRVTHHWCAARTRASQCS
jgi:hypothetical protein